MDENAPIVYVRRSEARARVDNAHAIDTSSRDINRGAASRGFVR
jgi:hypothetical protein